MRSVSAAQQLADAVQHWADTLTMATLEPTLARLASTGDAVYVAVYPLALQPPLRALYPLASYPLRAALRVSSSLWARWQLGQCTVHVLELPPPQTPGYFQTYGAANTTADTTAAPTAPHTAPADDPTSNSSSNPAHDVRHDAAIHGIAHGATQDAAKNVNQQAGLNIDSGRNAGLALALNIQGLHSVVAMPLVQGDNLLASMLLVWPGELPEFAAEAYAQACQPYCTRLQQLLLEQRQRYRRALLHSAPTVLLLDHRGYVREVAAGIASALGYRPEDISGRYVFDMLHPSNQEEAKQLWQTLQHDVGRVLQHSVWRWRHARGYWQWLRCRWHNRLRDGDVAAVVLSIENLSQSSSPAAQTQRLRYYRSLALELSRVSPRQFDDFGFYQRFLEQVMPLVPGAQAASLMLQSGKQRYRHIASIGHGFSIKQQNAPKVDAQALLPYMPSANHPLATSNSQAQLEHNPHTLQQLSAARMFLTGRLTTVYATISATVHVVMPDNGYSAHYPQALLFFDALESHSHFPPEALEFVNLIATQLASLLQRFMLQERAEQRLRFQRALAKLAKQALELPSQQAFYNVLVEQAVVAVPAAQAASLFLREADGRFRYVASRGLNLSSLQIISFAYRDVSYAFDWRAKHAVLLTDLETFLDKALQTEYLRTLAHSDKHARLHASIAVPVIVAGDLAAILYLDNFADAEAFSEEALRIAEAFAAQASMVLERLRWQTQAQRQAAFQQLLARLERLLLEFDSLQDFFPLLSDMLTHEDHMPIQHILVCRSHAAGQLSLQRYGLDPVLAQQNGNAQDSSTQSGDVQSAGEQALIAQVIREQRSYYAADVLLEPAYVDAGGSSADTAEQLRSLALYPLRSGQLLWGVFGFAAAQPYAFDTLVCDFFAQVMHSVELALLKQADRERIVSELERIKAVVAVNEMLRESQSLYEVYQACVSVALEQSSSDYCYLLRYDESREVLVLVSDHSRNDEDSSMVGQELRQGLSWQVLQQGSSLQSVVREAKQVTVYVPVPFVYLGIPLSDQAGQVLGVLVACRQGEQPLKASECSFLEALAQTCSNAIVRQGLIVRSENEALAYRALANFSATIEEINEVDSLIELGIESLQQQLGFEIALYYQVEKDAVTASLRLHNSWGDPGGKLSALPAVQLRAFGEGICGKAALYGQAIPVDYYHLWSGAEENMLALGVQSALALPVHARQEVTSVVVLYSVSRRLRLQEDKITIAQSFVRRLENAIERADYLSEVKETREATLRSLGLVLEYRDFETKGHTDRVMQLSVAFGQAMGFDEDMMQAMRWGAYLHDMGKVAISDSVLLKPSKLSHEEYESIKQHTMVGYNIASEIVFLPVQTRQIIRSHHERWDGTGYPDALAGEDIPLMARMFSLVDVYDALISPRPYKTAWLHEDVLAYIEAAAGTQFDPKLVPIFLTMLHTYFLSPRA